MLVTALAILVTNIHYVFIQASGSNIQKMLPTSKFCHQYSTIVTNFWPASPFYAPAQVHEKYPSILKL